MESIFGKLQVLERRNKTTPVTMQEVKTVVESGRPHVETALRHIAAAVGLQALVQDLISCSCLWVQ